jgi:hypothetical protein
MSKLLLVNCQSWWVSTAQLLSTSVLALKYEYELNGQKKKKRKFCEFISKRRIISLRHSSILRWIWLNFKALCLVFIRRLFQFSHFFRISNFFDMSINEEIWVVEMRIWCIKIVTVLVLHAIVAQSLYNCCKPMVDYTSFLSATISAGNVVHFS